MKDKKEDNTLFDFEIKLTRGHFQLDAKLQSASTAIAITGASGSGKSTLVRILAGLEKKATGHVTYQGRKWLNAAESIFLPPWQRRVGYVPQDSLLIPHLNILENLAFSGATGEAVAEIADQLFITPLLKRRPRMLSGGEKQRVSLGRALLSNPELLLLDEPFSALDRTLRKQVSEVLNEICGRRKLPFILISHDESDVLNLAQEIWSVHGESDATGQEFFLQRGTSSGLAIN